MFVKRSIYFNPLQYRRVIYRITCRQHKFHVRQIFGQYGHCILPAMTSISQTMEEHDLVGRTTWSKIPDIIASQSKSLIKLTAAVGVSGDRIMLLSASVAARTELMALVLLYRNGMRVTPRQRVSIRRNGDPKNNWIKRNCREIGFEYPLWHDWILSRFYRRKHDCDYCTLILSKSDFCDLRDRHNVVDQQ